MASKPQKNVRPDSAGTVASWVLVKKTGAVEAPVYLCEEGYACLKN
jgi:hypothetical protein